MSKAKRYVPSKKTNKLFQFKRGNFLYLFLAPLFLAIILSLLQQDISTFLLSSTAFGLFFLTAKLNTIGLNNEYKYHTRTLTKAPIPYKSITAILLGLSTLFTAWIVGEKPFFTGLFLGFISTLGYFLYYGLDPRKDKLENIGDISAQFVLETLATARATLAEVEEEMQKIREKNLHQKLRIATDKAYEILNNIEDDPKDLRVARKFIIIYIDGIKKVTTAYTEIDEEEITAQTKARLSTLLSDVEKRFDEEILRLKQNNQFDLDVQIDVLHQQIKN
jgi:5-bromo-4-chloroindolyl phosphate hydrolysis protein